MVKEVFEKIIERLEERTSFLSDCTKYGNIDAEQQNKSYSTMMMYEVADLVDDLIEIVKQEAAEYTSTEHINCSSDSSTNGWIPCSERLPEEYDSIFAKLKGTDKWDDALFEKTSDDVNVTVADGYGNKITTHAYTVDGKWHCDLLKINKSYKIIAWQPLPEPYKQE